VTNSTAIGVGVHQQGPQHPRDVPARYGPWQTVYGLFRRWQRDGTWTRILTRLQAQAMWTPSGALASFVGEQARRCRGRVRGSAQATCAAT
jgi:transposase